MRTAPGSQTTTTHRRVPSSPRWSSRWSDWGAGGADALERATQGLVEELLACHQWRVEVVAWLEGSPPPQDEVALYDLLLEAVDLVVSLGINDSWYGLVVPVVAWTLERHGLDVPRELEDTLYNLTCGRFTSWSEPSVRDRRAFAEAAALEALDRQLEELWPAPPGGEQA